MTKAGCRIPVMTKVGCDLARNFGQVRTIIPYIKTSVTTQGVKISPWSPASFVIHW